MLHIGSGTIDGKFSELETNKFDAMRSTKSVLYRFAARQHCAQKLARQRFGRLVVRRVEKEVGGGDDEVHRPAERRADREHGSAENPGRESVSETEKTDKGATELRSQDVISKYWRCAIVQVFSAAGYFGEQTAFRRLPAVPPASPGGAPAGELPAEWDGRIQILPTDRITRSRHSVAIVFCPQPGLAAPSVRRAFGTPIESYQFAPLSARFPCAVCSRNHHAIVHEELQSR